MKIAIFSIIFFLFWGVMSLFGLGDLKGIDAVTFSIIIICTLFFLFGVFFSVSTAKKQTRLSIIQINESRIIFLFKLFAFTQFILYTFLIYFWLLIIKDVPNIGTYRILAFGTQDSPSILFGNQQIALLYWIFCFAFNHVLLYLGVYLFFKSNRKVYLIVGFLPVFFDSLVFMGRGAFVELVHVIIFVIFVKKEFLRQSILLILRRNKKFIVFLLFVIAFMISISSLRGDVEKVEIKYVIKDQLINYNTVGFVIFDYQLNNQNSFLNRTNSFAGRTTFGGIENLVYLFVSRFDPSFRCIIGESNEDLDKMKEVNLGEFGNEKYYNAFTTVLYNTFLDGGLIWSVIYFFSYGFVLTTLIRMMYTNFFYLVFALPFFQNMLTSIYRSMLGDMGFIVCLLILLYIYITSSKKIRQVV